MRKKLLVVTMTAGMSLMLFACGSNGDKETTAQLVTEETVAEVETTQEVTTVEETTKEKKEETTQEVTTVQETTTPAPTTVATTTKKVEKVTEKKTKKAEKTTKKSEKATKKTEKATKKSEASGKATAKKYVGKTVDSLVAAVGKYKTSEKAPSCLYEGEQDGIFYWKDFSVSAHTKNGKWIIDSVF